MDYSEFLQQMQHQSTGPTASKHSTAARDVVLVPPETACLVLEMDIAEVDSSPGSRRQFELDFRTDRLLAWTVADARGASQDTILRVGASTIAPSLVRAQKMALR